MKQTFNILITYCKTNHYKTYINHTILLYEVEFDLTLINAPKKNQNQIKNACQFPSSGGSDHGLGTDVNRKSAIKIEELNPSSAN